MFGITLNVSKLRWLTIILHKLLCIAFEKLRFMIDCHHSYTLTRYWT